MERLSGFSLNLFSTRCASRGSLQAGKQESKKSRKERHMNMNDHEKPQPLLPLSEGEEMQDVGEEQLEDVNGGRYPQGVLMTPGRGILQRSYSAPGQLQGNHYITPTGSPASPA